MLAAVTVPYKSFALLPFPTGLDSETPPQAAPINADSATLDDYTDAFIAVSGQNVAVVCRNPDAIPQGGTLQVNVTFSAKSQDGTALPAIVRPVVFQGAPLPPQAAQLVEADPVVQAYNANGSNVPGDPGSATVTF